MVSYADYLIYIFIYISAKFVYHSTTCLSKPELVPNSVKFTGMPSNDTVVLLLNNTEN